MKRHLRLWLSVLGLVACRQEPAEPKLEPVQVRCQRPQRGSLDETVVLRGRIEPPPGNSLSVASQVPGRVMRLLVHEGQHIDVGQAVAIVDGLAARDALRQADAQAAQAKAVAANADATLARIRTLVGRGIAARQELEDAQARAETAHAGVAAAAASSDFARRTLGRVQVRSGLAGVVTRVQRGAGALVDGSAATPILDLASASALEFVGVASQADLGSLRVGQPALGALSGADGELQGKVRALPSALDPATGLALVRIALDGAGPAGPVGVYGRMTVSTGRHENALLLPVAALRGAIADGAEVVVCKDGKASLRSITVGLHNDRQIEVKGGLGANESVAVDHVLGLDDATPIREVQ